MYKWWSWRGVSVEVIKLFLLLYADDQVIFAKSPETLHAMLLDIEYYCNAWGLKINTAKTKTMIFEKGRHTSYDFYLNNTNLEVVTSFKYLGVYFFINGNWHRTQNCIADPASFALHNLFSFFTQVEIPVFKNANCLMYWSVMFWTTVLKYGETMKRKTLNLSSTNFAECFVCPTIH